MSVCGIRILFSLSCNTEVNWKDLDNWLVMFLCCCFAIYYYCIFLPPPHKGHGKARNIAFVSWSDLLMPLMFLTDTHKLFKCQDTRNGVDWIMHLSLASWWSSTPPVSCMDVFLPGSSLPLRWSNTIRGEEKTFLAYILTDSYCCNRGLGKENQPSRLKTIRAHMYKRVAHRCPSLGRKQ